MIDLRECLTLRLMPEVFRNDPKIQAASYALQQTAKMLIEKIDNAAVYASIDILPDEILDLLAVELRSQYYDPAMEVEKKREIIRKTLAWFYHAGTLKTVKELTNFLFGENIVTEWFEYDGRPYTFRLEIMGLDVLITDKGMADFIAALQKVKNTRSLLECITFHRRIDGELFSGAHQDSYKREVIVDFFEEFRKDSSSLHAGTYQENYKRQAAVEHFTGYSVGKQNVMTGNVQTNIRRQVIKEE